MADFMVNFILIPAACILAAFCVLVLGMALFGPKSPTFELRKDGWTCTASHTHRSALLVPAGKVLIPVPRNDTVCDQWSAKD